MTGAPILPEHDIELAFDVQFSVEDVVEVRQCAGFSSYLSLVLPVHHLTMSTVSGTVLRCIHVPLLLDVPLSLNLPVLFTSLCSSFLGGDAL